MKSKHSYYDRISQVRMLRSVIAGLLFCIALLLFAVFTTGQQVEALSRQVADMTMEVRLLTIQ